MKKMRIGVVFGGQSNEYDVSLKSAFHVINGLLSDTYEVIMIGITRRGEWLLYEGEVEKVKEKTWHLDNQIYKIFLNIDGDKSSLYYQNNLSINKLELDLLFPVLHGKNGEDGSVQGMLDLCKNSYIGCGLLSSALCIDKRRAQLLVKEAGVDITKSEYINKNVSVEQYEKILSNLKYPVFVKPIKSGSSIGINKVNNFQEIESAINDAYQYDDEITIEEEILGFEVGCSIIGNDELIIGRVDEIDLNAEFFDYTEKYTQINSKIITPARIDSTLEKRIIDCAKLIYRTLGCKDFARVDLFVSNNKIYFNEVNTIPGFTTESRFFKMLKCLDYSFTDVLDLIVQESEGYKKIN